MRIVSLLPSSTEMVALLGLEDALVGVTHECDYPDGIRGLPMVTRSTIPADATSAEVDRLVRERVRSTEALYTLDVDTLERLRPDLIVTQALCDVCAVAEDEVRAAACRLPGQPPVVNLEPRTLDDVLAAILQVAEAAGVAPRGQTVVGELRRRIDAVARRTAGGPRPRVAFLEWLDPPFSAGHWNPELVALAGGEDVLGVAGEKSRTLTWEEVAEARPDVVFIACCGYDVPRTVKDVERLHQVPEWEALPAVRAGRVYVTDGSQYFNRPGPRLVDSLEILAHALDPSVPLPAGAAALVRMRTVQPGR